MSQPLNQQGRKAQAECVRRFLAAAEGYPQSAADQYARNIENGDVEADPAWLETLPSAGNR